MADIPAEYTNVEFCRIEGDLTGNAYRVWEKTNAQIIPADSNLFTQNDDVKTGTWSFTEEIEPTLPDKPAAPDVPVNPSIPTEPEAPGADLENAKKVYFTPNELWAETVNSSIGRLSVHAWNTATGEDTWVWLEVFNSEELMYSASVPADCNSVSFGVSFSDSPDGVWYTTDDQTIPENSNYFIQDSDDDTIGTWSYYGDTIAEAKNYFVVFVDDDGRFIRAQIVKEGEAAVAPEAPVKASDAQYTYTFIGWDADFESVTEDTIVTALYKKTINKYEVTFVDKDGNVLDTQVVEYGYEATAPAAPVVDGYTFTGWSEAFDYVTKDITVKAQYKKIVTPPAPATTGTLKVEVAGGTSFTISIANGAARPQGATYFNAAAPLGAAVTVTANASSDAEFIGWVNTANGRVLTTDLSYTFNTSGSDYIKAMYSTKVSGVQMVIFYNDRLEQQVDVQYYAATDAINMSLTTASSGYDFKGWNMTEAEIQAEIAAGNDVTVLPVWERQLVYVALDVIGGTVTAHGGEKDGKYLANAKTTVTANAPAAGEKFAYWTVDGKVVSYDTVYSFFPKTDAKLEAVFVGENDTVDYVVLSDITNFDQTAVSNKYASFTTNWYVPEDALGIDFIDGGLVAINKDYYEEGKLYVGSSLENMQTKTSTSTKAIDSYTWIGPVTSGQTWVVRSFVRYRDANGETQTVYSDVYEFTKTN